MVEASPSFSDGGGVGQHADGPGNLGKVTSRNNSRWLVVDANLEASGAPVDKLDGPLGLDGGDGSIDILGDNITTVKHAASHVLAMAGVTLDHLVGRLKASIGDFRNRELLMVSLLSRDDWSIGDQWEVDPRVGHQVGLELGQVNIEGTVKAEGGSDGGHNLSDQPVEVGIGGPLDIQVSAADVIDGLIVNHERAIGVLQSGVGRQNRIVRFDNGRGNLTKREYNDYNWKKRIPAKHCY